MTLFSDGGAEDFRPDRVWPQPDGDYLEADELLSSSGGDLGLDIDPAGYLMLIEGADVD